MITTKRLSELICPRCEVSLDVHEAGDCLDYWVAIAMGWECSNRGLWINESGWAKELNWWSTEDHCAIYLMELIWEKDPGATISKYHNKYHIGLFHSETGPREIFEHESLPMGICQAYISLQDYLANK